MRLVFTLASLMLFPFFLVGSLQAQSKDAKNFPPTDPVFQQAEDVFSKYSDFFAEAIIKNGFTQRASLQPVRAIWSDKLQMHPAVIQELEDSRFDYVVQWTEPVEGQSEFVVDVIYDVESCWTRLHRWEWCGSINSGSLCDMGEYIFDWGSTATEHAEALLQSGEILLYRIIERPVTEDWETLEIFDTQREAEIYAEGIEQAARLLGETRITRIIVAEQES